MGESSGFTGNTNKSQFFDPMFFDRIISFLQLFYYFGIQRFRTGTSCFLVIPIVRQKGPPMNRCGCVTFTRPFATTSFGVRSEGALAKDPNKRKS
jgi:hypothetical protein